MKRGFSPWHFFVLVFIIGIGLIFIAGILGGNINFSPRLQEIAAIPCCWNPVLNKCEICPVGCTDPDTGPNSFFTRDRAYYINSNGQQSSSPYDFCSGNNLSEYYCPTPIGNFAAMQKNCLELGSSYICDDGKCSSQNTCVDSDGINYTVKGNVTITYSQGGASNMIIYNDTCDATSNNLIEYFCLTPTSSAPSVNFVNCTQQFGQNYICDDGACVIPAETYLLVPIVYNVNGINFTDVFRGTNEPNLVKICANLVVGSICDVGSNIHLQVYEMFYNATLFGNVTQDTVSFISTTFPQGRFDKSFDQYGNYIILPTENMFPTNQYTINIYNSTGSVITNRTYGWQNGNITTIGPTIPAQHGFNFKIVAPRADLILNTILINQTISDGPRDGKCTSKSVNFVICLFSLVVKS